MSEYNVIENMAGSLKYIAEADHVIAFCGTQMYIVKSRSHNPDPMPPCKPEKIVAFYRFPEPHVAELLMRSNHEYKEEVWCSMGHAVGQRGCALCEEF